IANPIPLDAPVTMATGLCFFIIVKLKEVLDYMRRLLQPFKQFFWRGQNGYPHRACTITLAHRRRLGWL
ncbi:MAG: hypothetical protein WA949_06850, partial [Phormidesmis sp.]